MMTADATRRREKILIVDDTPANLLILGENLKDVYDVYVSTHGEAALRQVELNPPDLILLDVMMPEMDGYEVCRRLQESPSSRRIPVIFITGRGAEEDEIQGLAAGAVDYITKPFSLPIVRARVRTHLELKRKTDLLETISMRDSLTGLFNRRQLEEALSLEWGRALRNRKPLALILVDIDFFKLYNDSHGHLAGDDCLRNVASAIASGLRRSSDFVARFGGEEFCVVLPDTTQEGARQVAERVRRSVEVLGIRHGKSAVAGVVTVSLGVSALVPENALDHTHLIQMADDALYAAKESGRNRVHPP